MVPNAIERIVGFLEDGEWHTFKEIREYSDLPEVETWRIVRFLEEFGFLNVNEEELKARLSPSFLKLPV